MLVDDGRAHGGEGCLTKRIFGQASPSLGTFHFHPPPCQAAAFAAIPLRLSIIKHHNLQLVQQDSSPWKRHQRLLSKTELICVATNIYTSLEVVPACTTSHHTIMQHFDCLLVNKVHLVLHTTSNETITVLLVMPAHLTTCLPSCLAVFDLPTSAHHYFSTTCNHQPELTCTSLNLKTGSETWPFGD